MPKSYTYNVLPTGSEKDENFSVHQSTPSWVLTFVRWKYRDTYRIKNAKEVYNNPDKYDSVLNALKITLDPIVVINDCVSVSINSSKSSYTPNMEATLLQTDINYLTAIAPGDFVLVNMVNSEEKALSIYNRANSKNPKAINNFNDGFKGIFKIQSVRRMTSVIDSNTGKKSVVFKITGFAFTEFNNMLYFDPSVTLQAESSLIFAKQISETWKQLVSANKNQNLQDLIKSLITSFIGSSSLKKNAEKVSGGVYQTPNTQYFMPAIIGKLLGTKNNVSTAADIYNYIFGIQKYDNKETNSTRLGFNPVFKEDPQKTSNNFFYTQKEVAGKAILSSEYWNQVKVWDVLNQYINSPLNEFFTCFRVSPDTNRIMPTVILRQIPFTNEDFFVNNPNVNNYFEVTKFLSLPRWKISPGMIIAQDIGRDEALRINYVQIFARVINGSLGSDYTAETARGNFKFDLNDIQRSGLRPTVRSSMFDLFDSKEVQQAYNTPAWASIYADAVIGGHLKMSGTFTCAGIVDPIAVGDNLEFENIVYHIEQISHSCFISPESGIKSFRTVIVVSQGISSYSNAEHGVFYPEMSYTNAYAERNWDYKKSKILPGVSESQNVPYRENLDNINDPLEKPNESLPQPKQNFGSFADSDIEDSKNINLNKNSKDS